jgi:predicted TPR repeat methyltransferase
MTELQPDDLFARALALHRAGSLAEAMPVYRAALAADSGHVRSLVNLASIVRGFGQPVEAVELLRRALVLAPEDAVLHYNLANALIDSAALNEAEAHAGLASRLRPGWLPPLLQLGWLNSRQGRFDDAVVAWRQVVALAPHDAGHQRHLAAALRGAGRNVEALAAYRRVLELDPGDAVAGFVAAALAGERPPQAPPAFVRHCFDSYALEFEAALVGGLGYRAPALLAALIERHAPARPFARALDLGCGTGLMGRALRAKVGHLTGVDLAPRIIDAARSSGAYDELYVDEIHGFLDARAERWDLITAADVLPYFGDLRPLMAGLAGHCTDGGYFALSTEHHDGEGWVLPASCRYRHAASHVETAARDSGLVVVAAQVETVRHERHEPVPGGLYLLAPAAA